jgi:molybdate transport system regulatory protein
MESYFPTQYDVKLRVFCHEPAFGKGVVQLLQGVQEKGSLTAAYQQMGMAASKAWKILNRAEKDLGVCLVERHSGGMHGGRSALTPEGVELLVRYQKFSQAVQRAAEEAFLQYFRGD